MEDGVGAPWSSMELGVPREPVRVEME